MEDNFAPRLIHVINEIFNQPFFSSLKHVIEMTLVQVHEISDCFVINVLLSKIYQLLQNLVLVKSKFEVLRILLQFIRNLIFKLVLKIDFSQVRVINMDIVVVRVYLRFKPDWFSEQRQFVIFFLCFLGEEGNEFSSKRLPNFKLIVLVHSKRPFKTQIFISLRKLTDLPSSKNCIINGLKI